MSDAAMNERLISAEAQRGDTLERAMRPRRLAEYGGQQTVTDQLDLFITAARERRDALDHVLLYGPPGLGKTTLAAIIANELDVRFMQTSGPVLERPGDLAAILTSLEDNDVLFIDEIHRLSPVVEEVLYPAMEDYQIDIMTGEGASARSFKIDLPPFTLVGATTRAGLLTAPLRDRFGIVQRLEFYAAPDLARIVTRSAQLMGVQADADGCLEIARRARGTPRIANRLLSRVRDFAQVRADGMITAEVANDALNLLAVDTLGLDKADHQLMHAIMHKFSGGPVGLDNLAAAMSEDRGTLEEVVEPYLIQQGLIMRTARGRIVTENGWRHFGLDPTGLGETHTSSLQAQRSLDIEH